MKELFRNILSEMNNLYNKILKNETSNEDVQQKVESLLSSDKDLFTAWRECAFVFEDNEDLKFLYRISVMVLRIFDEEKNDPESSGKFDITLLKSVTNFLSKFAVFPLIEPGLIDDKVVPLDMQRSECNNKELSRNIRSLLEFVDRSKLHEELLTENLSNILLALLQLCFSKNSSSLPLSDKKCMLQWLNKLLDDWFDETAVLRRVLKIMQRTKTNWLRQKCGFILSQSIIKPSGVAAFFTVITDLLTEDHRGDWKFCLLASDLLSTAPKHKHASKYFTLVFPQLIDMLKNDNAPDITFIIVNTIQRMYDKNETDLSFQQVFMELSPINHYKIKTENNYSLATSELDAALNVWIKIIHISSERVNFLRHIFNHDVFLLHKIYLLFQNATDSLTRDKIKDVLTYYIGTLHTELAVKHFMCFCGYESVENSFRDFSCELRGERVIFSEKKHTDGMENLLQQQDNKVEGILSLLKHCKNKDLIGHFFISLIKHFTSPLDVPSTTSTALLSAEDRIVSEFEANEKKLITFAIIMHLVENEDPKQILSHPIQIIQFVKVTLNNWHDSDNIDDNESVRLCFSVIGLLLLQELNMEERNELRGILPTLQKISVMENAGEIQNLSLEISIAIATLTNYASKEQASEEQDKLLERLCKAAMQEQSNNTSHDVKQTETLSKKPLIEEITANFQVEELLNSAKETNPAIAGGAIRELTKLYKNKSMDLVVREGDFVDLLQHGLRSDDSFVYISAVQGLAVVATSSKSGEIFEKLISDLQTRVKNEETGDIALKVAEVLSRSIQQLGDLSPIYAPKLASVFLQSMPHRNNVLRASMLSNMSDLITLTPDSFRHLRHEVCMCYITMTSSANDVEIRRSSVFGIRNLIEKLQEKFLMIFDDVVKEFYRCLKQVYNSDTDEVVKLHSQLALEAINELMKKNIFAKQNLTKNISVLSCPK